MAGIILVCLAGCNPVTRHRILTFFFDGVPPLVVSKGRTLPDPNALADPNAIGGLNQESLKSWGSRHEPARDCSRCHADGFRWNRKQFKRPLPQLCYECHTNYSVAPGYIHGPVGVGACIYCHKPHQSEFPSLLRYKYPDLCYQCHQERDVLSIESHQNVDISRCDKCHDPHISPIRKLLKITVDDTESVNSSSPGKQEVTE